MALKGVSVMITEPIGLVAASQLSKAKAEERELLLHWADVVEYA